ncbi:MAG: 4-alpha-glucanotransferase [Deltaproteobacteria bacterium RIFOXYD12_FULL_57_12]|nr:MAG: 4-alpha-glucanotransferase [Deltaproteobacteria bacterium RIFOXYD12_FULL_57_12]
MIPTHDRRGSGILLHITSLPGAYGFGDLGATAFRFIDFLAEAGQRYWQILPFGPTNSVFGNSPYMSMSAFAGNPLCIALDDLQAAGLLSGANLSTTPPFSEYLVDFDAVLGHRNKLLHQAFLNFTRQGGNDSADFQAFCCQAGAWLDDYALFMSLKEQYRLKPWNQWPRPIATRTEDSLTSWRVRLAGRIQYYKFEQFCFASQWRRVHDYATQKGISLIGDIPIYLANDSADVWTNQDFFKLDPKTLEPTHVAGVPPDYFSKTGQRWGNPVYRWQMPDNTMNSRLLSWWQERFRHLFSLLDLIRIDHFRGFESYWEIPANEKTAINGQWIKGPGPEFFKEVENKLGPLAIIAEDLGLITPAVEKLRDDLGYPGMKVLQFAFDSDETNPYLPHNYRDPNCVVYTGTHDNDTAVGWLLSDMASPPARRRLKKYANSHDDQQIHWDLIRLALASVAKLAIIPLQDLLGFGGDCRMNLPGTSQGNWRWRCAPRFLTAELSTRLRAETEFYNRCQRPLQDDAFDTDGG